MSLSENIHQYLLQGGVVRSATFLDRVKELLKGFRTPFAKNTAHVATIPPMSKKEQLLSYSVFIALCVVVIASMRYLENQTVRNWNVALFMILITYGYFQVSKTLSVLMFIAFVVFYLYGGSRNADTKVTEHFFAGRNTVENFEDPVTIRDVDSGDEDEYEEDYEDEENLEHFEATKPRTQRQRQRHRNVDDSDDEEGIEQFGIEDTFMDLHKQIHETFAKHQQHTDNKKAKKA
jgi:hypothetical protein